MSQPAFGHPATARGLICDQYGRWLVVQPVNAEHWLYPGGLVELNESPEAACHREVLEETGLSLPPRRLRVVAWTPPKRSGSRARYTFLFDLGHHDADEIGKTVRLQQAEVRAWRWLEPSAAGELLHPDLASCMSAAARQQPSAVWVGHR